MHRSLPGLLSCLALGACGQHGTAPSQQSGVPPAITYEAHLAAGGHAPAGATLRNPHEGDPAVAKNGSALFTAMNCDGCHGTDGSGWVGPSLADRRWRYGGADGEIFTSIYYGRPKGMPAFGGTVGAEGVWSLVTYIRSLPLPSDVPTESWVVEGSGADQGGKAPGARSVNSGHDERQAHREHPATRDPYLWLEDVHGAKPLEWVKGQNARSIALLKADPSYEKDYEAILKVMDATDRIPYGDLDHEYVFNFWQDAQHPKGIWRRTTIADYANPAPGWDILLDLDQLAKDEHENWVWKGAECSPALRRCLLHLSRGGGDAVVVREFDLAAREFVKDGFQLAEAKSAITYLDEDTVLFGTDFGPGSMTASGYPRIVKWWRRGEPQSEARTIYEGKQSDVGAQAVVFRDPSGSLALVERDVSFFTAEYHLIESDGKTRQLPLPLGADLRGAQGRNLIFTLREDWAPQGGGSIAKGSLISCRVTEPGPAPLGTAIMALYTPDSRSAINEVVVGRDAVYASIYHDVTGAIHVLRPTAGGTWSHTTLALPRGGSTHVVAANSWGPEALFRFESYTTPTTLYADAGDGKPVALRSLPARFDASSLRTEQFFATSRDSTRVPYFVTRTIRPAGPVPTVLYGYGGFEISQTPSYSPNFGMLWLSRGGAFVVANIRGGGEYGPAWHQAALLANRQKAYDDFQAVAEDLVKRGITTPRQLGIMGGSNGGLLVSANMVQRPELFGAVVCQVPLIDMIRYTHIGAGASWAAEYGDPDSAADRAWIMKYSPYQNVKADRSYPPVFFVTATSDDRVTPVHARKMAARMLAQGHEVLFYENTDGGHAAAADHKQAAEMWALSFVYLAQKLGVEQLGPTPLAQAGGD